MKLSERFSPKARATDRGEIFWYTNSAFSGRYVRR